MFKGKSLLTTTITLDFHVTFVDICFDMFGNTDYCSSFQLKLWNFPHRTGSYKIVYYESIKRELKIRGIYECRCDERLQTKTKRFTRLPYTGLVLELEHLKIETRLISERFANAMGECEN